MSIIGPKYRVAVEDGQVGPSVALKCPFCGSTAMEVGDLKCMGTEPRDAGGKYEVTRVTVPMHGACGHTWTFHLYGFRETKSARVFATADPADEEKTPRAG